jgi:hypothetical protein
MQTIKNNNSNLKKFKDDFIFGLAQEDVLLEVIKKKFGNDIIKTKERSIFDYESDNILVELKSRRVKKDTYPDTMIGINKINFASKSDKEVYFAFQFTDNLYYWKYDKDELLNFRGGGRSDRGKNEYKQYCYIPIKLLSLF